MHEPYENRFHHKADFRVRYRFRSAEEGGRKTGSAFQGYRSDFSFVGVEGAFMIFPEFEDAEGNLILYNDQLVPNEGTARMWVVYEAMRPHHYDRVKVGAKGHFQEGGRIVADCEVVEVLDLKVNPTRSG